MLHLCRTVALCAAAVLLSAVAASAQEKPFVWCSPRMLDVRAWPPTEPKLPTGAHLMLIEVQNRSSETCRLEGGLKFYPPNSNWNTYWYADASDAAKVFKDRKFALAPGELVHQVLIWSSRPAAVRGMPFYACRSHDTLLLSFDSTRSPVKIQNLGIQACNIVWLSSARLGRYELAEPFPPEWLKLFNLKAEDFTPILPIQPLEASGPNPLVSLRTLYSVDLIPHFMEIHAILPHPATLDCPFDVLRRRDDSGETAIYVNHCGGSFVNAPL
jgi:hypothetical protein